jgi:hypothetical protein
MNWQPEDAIKVEGEEELQSNLTLEEVQQLASEIPFDDNDGVDIDGTIVVEVE